MFENKVDTITIGNGIFTMYQAVHYNIKSDRLREKEGNTMDRMFRVLGFWTGIFAIMFYLGDMKTTSLLFFGQTGFFVLLSYLKLTERMYIYIFGAYLTIFFVGFTYWTTFMMVPGQGGH
jgi:hypothetical protein